MATSKFGEAFRAAREAGDKEFTFNGKKFNTKMAGDEPQSVGGKLELGKYKSRDDRSPRVTTLVQGDKRTPMPKKPDMEIMSKSGDSRGVRNMYERGAEESGALKTRESTENTDTSDMTYKRGGSVKASKMGGVKTSKPSFGSASKRSDGIATKGKTRGKFI